MIEERHNFRSAQLAGMPPRPGLIPMKRAMFLIGGLCWFLFALGFGCFLVQYVAQGAGLQFFGLGFSSGSVLTGLVHLVGMVMASGLCFAIGVGLCAHGIVGEKAEE